MYEKQVEKGHYAFASYLHKRRWASMWHQLDEVLALNPATVLEIGPGPGVFKAVATLFGVKVDTLDLDPELEPDYVARADALPFVDNSYDVVCAFQMLEHVPYETTLKIFAEMSRVARRYIVISLPDSLPATSCVMHLPRNIDLKMCIPIPWPCRRHIFDGEHYWEISKKGWPLKKVAEDLCAIGRAHLKKTYRVKENPYHRFFLFEKS